jgi:two-component system response regulator ResD
MDLVILFVEKDVTVVDLLVPSLERKGYQVFVAQSRRHASRRLQSLRPDVLIVDVASFGTAGDKVSDALRARLDGVPTILLVAEQQPAPGRPPDAVMTPPFTLRKLLYRLKKVAAKVADPKSHEIQVGPLALDTDTRILRKGTESMHLRPMEATLLLLFMQNPGKVLSRQEIMKQVWKTEYLGDTRTISVHVRWLREKIEEEPTHPRLLRTVRGVGYRFEVPEDAPNDVSEDASSDTSPDASLDVAEA